MHTHLNYSVPVHRPGIVGRLYAFLFEAVLCMGLYFVFVVPQGLTALLEPTTFWTTSLLEQKNVPFRELIHPVFIHLLLTFISIGTISSLLFSSSLGLAFLGAYTQGGLFSARIKAVIRFFLGLVTGPFIIFDLPALFGWATLKEGLTFSKMSYRSTYTLIFGIFLLPILCLFVLCIPLAQNYNTLTKISYTKEEKPVPSPPKDNDYRANLPLHHLRIRASLRESEHILPLFEYKNDAIHPKVVFVDTEKKSALFYGPADFVNIRNFIEIMARNDPFFRMSFPNLYEYIENPYKARVSMDKKAYLQEMSSLYSAVLSLNVQNLPHFITAVSPAIGPYLRFKRAIIMGITPSLGGSLKEFTLGHLSLFEYGLSRRNIHVIFHPSELLGRIVSWNIQTEGDGRPIRQQFLQRFIKRASFSPLESEVSIFDGSITSFNLIHFLYRIRTYPYDPKHYEKIFGFFKRKVESSGDEYYRRFLEDSLLSFQSSHSKIQNVSLEKAESLRNLIHEIGRFFERDEP